VSTTYNHLPSIMQQYIHLSRYARWNNELKRRETWPETVARYFDFFQKHLRDNCSYKLAKELRGRLEDAVLNLRVMPSMRCLMTAGEALEREHVAGYNCAYVAVDSPRAFDEIMYVMMCGTGIGFSVESKYVDQLPVIAETMYPTETTIVVADSRLGWAKAMKELIHLLYSGQIPRWDVGRVRPAGAPLKTFGGRASGPEPLVRVFEFIIKKFQTAAGRRLQPIECHDIICKIGEVVVVGGVRRAALISLSDVNDRMMRAAKSGQWWMSDPHRALSNNSYIVKDKTIDVATFLEEWASLYSSKSGERGIFSRFAAKAQVIKHGRRDSNHEFGCNPCSEIILRPNQFCNLTEVVVRHDDNIDDLREKIELATILGTMQATLTDFKYLTKRWQSNCQEERLLGVSMTGIMDCVLTNGTRQDLNQVLSTLRSHAVAVNARWSKMLGINQATAVTCVKPSGTVSQLVDSASGIHARHSQYYIRTIRADKKDPLTRVMVDAGFPAENDAMMPDTVTVFSFPIKSPENAVLRSSLDVNRQLELWRTYHDEWCEHKPSVTISVKDNEWVRLAAWVYDNMSSMSGVSFLPFSDHVYKQAPYQECDAVRYKELVSSMPKNVDWSKLAEYETTDHTTSSKEFVCTGNVCEQL